MGRTKPPSKLAANASKLHKRVLDLLCSDDSPYRFYSIRQEYPVNKVNPAFKSGREKFDVVILELKTVIEIHGQQHFEKVYFGGKMDFEAEQDLEKRKKVDKKKEKAAIKAGWAYLVVRYDEKNITLEDLVSKIQVAQNEALLRWIVKECVL